MISLRLFGSPTIDGEDGPLSGRAAQRHRLALLALLSTSPGHRLSRDKLLAYLWPESDTDRARHLLNVSVYVLRRDLGEDALVSVGDDVRLDAAIVRSDVAAFEEALERGEARRAVELYSAPFLDGFYLSGSTEFEHWVDTERARLASLHERALESLATDAEAGGDAEAAVAWWRQLSAHNPYSGHVAAGLMRALEAASDHAGAIQHATTHEELLKEEIGAQPDPEVVALAERLREHPSGEVGFSDAALSLGARAERADAATAGGKTSKGSKRRLFWAVGSAAALLLLVAVISVDGLLSPDPGASEPATPAGPVLEPNRVLIFPFTNQTGDLELDRLGNMAADWITQGLAETGLVRVVAATGIEPTEIIGVGSPAAVARLLAIANGAAIAIHGSLYRQGDSIAFQAQVTDVATGELLRAIGGISAPVQAPTEGVETLRQRTTAALATVLDPRLSSWAHATRQPPTYQAYQLFADGMTAFLRFRRYGEWPVPFSEAADYFQRAAELDSTFSLPLLWAVYATRNSRDYSTADSLVQVLEGRREQLTQWERAVLDAQLAEGAAARYEAYSRVVGLTPESEWRQELALSALQLNRPQEVVDILSEVDPERGWLATWEPYWEVLAFSRHLLGDHEQGLQDARRGRQHLPESKALERVEVWALTALGRVDASQYDEATLPMIVDELTVHGHTTTAERLIVDYVADYESSEDDPLWRAVYWLEQAGRLDEAAALLETQLEADPYDQWALGRLGVISAKRGDRAKALSLFKRLEEPREEWARLNGDVTHRRALIAANLGDNEEAVRLLRRARDEGYQLWIHLHRRHEVPQALRDYPPFQELMRPKG